MTETAFEKYLKQAVDRLFEDDVDFVIVVRERGKDPEPLCYSFRSDDSDPEDFDSPEHEEFVERGIRDLFEQGLKRMKDDWAEDRARHKRHLAKRTG